jgi:DNA-binding transcriptional LysR family regulator
MAGIPDIDDLRLALAVAETGSIGGAARVLNVAQPSASQRLARLERRTGVQLFDRDTRGARPTPAGAEFVHQAGHILGHLERVFDATTAAAQLPQLRVGAPPSLAESVLPALAAITGTDSLHVIEHGERLVAWAAEGTLDAAFVAIADQIVMPRGVVAHHLGGDELVLLTPAGVTGAGRGRLPLRDRSVVLGTLDTGSSVVHSRLAALGAEPVVAGTVPTAIALARRTGRLAVVPRSAARAGIRDGERISALPWSYRLTLSVVTPREAHPLVTNALPLMRRELGLT